MILTTILILIFCLLFSGVGFLFPWFQNRVKDQPPAFYDFIAAFWTGWALVIAFLQIWHLVFRIDALPLVMLAAAGIAGWVSIHRAVALRIGSVSPRNLVAAGVVAVFFAFVLANHVMYNPFNWDHGLYHLQAVKWLSNYSIVPGLGNLHHRLAFNNASFLYAALLNAGPLSGYAYAITNTLLAFVLLIASAGGFFKLFRPGGSIKLGNLYWALMLAPLIEHASTADLAGYSPDFSVFALQVALGGELLHLMEQADQKALFKRHALRIILLCAVGIAVKLSFAVFGGLVMAWVVFLWLKRYGYGFHLREDARGWLGWVGAAAILLVPWAARNIILSGYLLFPSTIISFPVTWKVPTTLVEPIAGIITIWARTASAKVPDTRDFAWFLQWLNFFPFIMRQVVVITLLVTGLNAVLTLVLRKRAKVPLPAFSLWTISLLSLVYWFFLAPSYRFSGALFWISLVSSLLAFISILVDSGHANPLALACVLVVALALWISPNHFSNNLSRAWVWFPPSEAAIIEKSEGEIPFITQQTTSGLVVYSPVSPSDQCYNLPLPCTPPNDFLPYLRLIDPRDVQKGFYAPRP